jgi:hypothetical protein
VVVAVTVVAEEDVEVRLIGPAVMSCCGDFFGSDRGLRFSPTFRDLKPRLVGRYDCAYLSNSRLVHCCGSADDNWNLADTIWFVRYRQVGFLYLVVAVGKLVVLGRTGEEEEEEEEGEVAVGWVEVEVENVAEEEESKEQTTK